MKSRWVKRTMSVVLTAAMVASMAPEMGPLVSAAEMVEGTEIAEALGADNVLANGDFSSPVDGTDWLFWTDEGGAGTCTANGGGGVDIAVTAEGVQNYAVQLTQTLTLEAGATYDLSCDITSATDAKVFINIQEDQNWTSIMPSSPYTVDVTAGETKHVSITTSETTDAFISHGKLAFMFGSGTGNAGKTINISNVVLQKHDTSADGPVDTSVGKEYDFSSGADHSGDAADPGTVKTDYELIWADEFDGNYGSDDVDPVTGLNLDNWSYHLGDGTTECSNPGWGNRELQCYTRDAANVGVNEDLDGDSEGDGLLRITAQYEEDGYNYADESTKKYTSARLVTTDKTDALFNATYGYMESRISLPETKGTWPAFWMLPQSTSIYGSWPVSGEIDIMETVGINTDSACGTLHWGTPVHVYEGSGYVDLNSNISNFHTYAIDWQPGKMTWYYDGVAINTLSNWESGFSGASDSLSFDAPFDQPFYMLLNLAVDSGQFGGTANKAVFEGKTNMYVDYVRAFQLTEGYADTAVRTSSGEVKDDWADYAGINQIADITGTNIVTDVADGNVNGLESNGTADNTKWYLAYQSDATDATAESVIADGKTWAKVGVNTPGAQDYSVQLIGHYNAKAGYLYEVSFDVYADGGMVGKKVNCDSKEWKGWTTYGVESFTLSDTSTHVSYLVDQKKDFDQCRIEFNLGAQGTGNVYIGNVKVEIVDPSQIDREEEHKALDDGNLIYNGTFDQGTNHFGYWTAAEGTTVSIPRYTTEKITDNDVSVVDIASKTNYENLADGVKYYERRAQIQAAAGTAPRIYQSGLTMPKDSYKLNFDLYGAADTSVTASIYKVNVSASGQETLGELIASTDAAYKAANKVSNYTWNFETPEEVENAALVLTFADGSSVQVDNVTMIAESLVKKADPTPVDENTTWAGDNGSGSSIALKQENGVYTAENVTSVAGTWYAPQFISSDFGLAAGNQYKVSFKYKLTGTTNNKIKYIVQENGGQWTVFNNGPTEITYDPATADGDGFVTYETTFAAGTSLDTVHLVFGLGDSEASGTNSFSFKDVSMTLVEAGEGEEGEGGSTSMPTSYSVNYELGTGAVNASANPKTVTHGSTVQLAAPARAGYVFLGWTLNTAGTNYITSLTAEQTTAAVTLYANWAAEDKAAAPTIQTQPAAATYAYKAAAKALNVAASVTDGGTLSYQWYRNTTSQTAGATVITGATAASYTPATTTAGTVYYYCVVTNTKSGKTAAATSSIAAVTVNKAANKISNVSSKYTKAYGAKAFTLKAKGQGQITYSSSNVKVLSIGKTTGKATIKGTGKVTVTITAAGNTNYNKVTKKVTITVKPKKAVLSKVTSAKAKTLKVSWKKDSKATGYQIQYSTSKKFKNAKSVTVKKNKTVTTTISKLKAGKKYYVRVRSYKKSGSTTIYGSWSTIKSKITKK